MDEEDVYCGIVGIVNDDPLRQATVVPYGYRILGLSGVQVQVQGWSGASLCSLCSLCFVES